LKGRVEFFTGMFSGKQRRVNNKTIAIYNLEGAIWPVCLSKRKV